MNYTFFIQPIKGKHGAKGPSDSFRFMLLPDNKRVTIPQEDYKALLSKNSVQTYLNLELSDTNKPNFKAGYIKVGTRMYPLIIVTTKNDGAFRIPFGPGQSGLEDLKRTFREIQIAFKKFENRKMALLRNQSAPRIHAGSPPKEEIDLFEKTVKGMNSDQGWSPDSDEPKAKANPNPSANEDTLNQKAKRPSQAPTRSNKASGLPNKGPQQTKPKTSKKKSSGNNMAKAIVAGALIAITIIGLLVATDSHAGELVGPPAPSKVKAETDLTRQMIDLKVQVKAHKPVLAATSKNCPLLGARASSSAGLSTFVPSGFEGLTKTASEE